MDDAMEEKKEPSNVAATAAVVPSTEESEMRGVHAVTHIPPNTICMSIPRRCLITVEMGQATDIGRAVLQSDLDLDAPKHIFLMIYILWDRKVNGASSFFHPYYEILPRTLHNMPTFWSEAELAELQGSYLLHQIADRNQAIAEDYRAICAVAPTLAQLGTLDDFKWARMCVCSRNFGLQIEGQRTSALVPHADMLNHYRPRETKWTFDEDRQAFTITTLQHISAGAEVLDSYGQKCNHRFLLNYGFAVEDNRELDGFCPNEVPLELTVSPADVAFGEKLEFWLRGEQPQQQQQQTLHLSNHQSREQAAANAMKRVRVCVSNSENTRSLFSLLRTMACSPEEIRAVSHPGGYPQSHTAAVSSPTGRGSLFGLSDAVRHYPHSQQPQPQPQHLKNNNNRAIVLTASPAPVGATYHRSCRDIRHPISLRNEQEAMRILVEIVHCLLSEYPTTLQQDLEALQNEDQYPKFSNRRHAKIQVRGEKEVLHHFATWARTAQQVLTVIECELREEVENGDGGAAVPSIEVRWRNSSSGVNHANNNTVTIAEGQTSPSFDQVIRRMEDDVDEGVHHTILRYCADVLGSLRREEFRNLRRQQQQQRGQPFARSSGRSSLSGYI